MGKKSKAPKAPDYTALAEQTAAAQRVNQYTPYGSLTYSQVGTQGGFTNPKTGKTIGGQPIYGQTLTLSPEQQRLLDQQNQTSMNLARLQDQATARVAAQQARGFGDENLSAMGSAYDPNMATNTATQAILNRLQPTLQQQRSGLETQLSNQGLARGTEAYNAALRDQNQRENDLYQQAALQGINLGMQQQGQTYQQAMARRQQGLQEQNYFNTRDINNLNALRSGSQVTTPQFGAAPGGANYSQAGQQQYQAALGNYNAQQQASGNLMGGLMGLGGAALQGAGYAGGFGALFSDRRLKENISKVGQLDNGLNVYSYRYKFGGPMHIGVMAQEVMEVNPSAVHIMPDGFLAVDYGAL